MFSWYPTQALQSKLTVQPFLVGHVAQGHETQTANMSRLLKTPTLCLLCAGQLKLGDFGLARIFGSPDRKWTNQVGSHAANTCDSWFAFASMHSHGLSCPKLQGIFGLSHLHDKLFLHSWSS